MAVNTIQAARAKGSVKPSMDELMDRARAIGALAREHALETEQNRQVSAALIGKMRAAELFRIMQPAASAASSMAMTSSSMLVPQLPRATARPAGFTASAPCIPGCSPVTPKRLSWNLEQDAMKSPRCPTRPPARPLSRKTVIA